MTTSRSEDLLVGMIGVAILPWIGWMVLRACREGKLPIGRSHVRKAERPGAFRTLLALYMGAALAVAIMTVDLLFGLGFRNSL